MRLLRLSASGSGAIGVAGGIAAVVPAPRVIDSTYSKYVRSIRSPMAIVLISAASTTAPAVRVYCPRGPMKLAFDEVAIVPLHIQKNIWATRTGFTYVPTVGEDLKLVNVKPAN